MSVEARGFLLAAPVAYGLGPGVVPVRNPGRLPPRAPLAGHGLTDVTSPLTMVVR